MVTGIRSPTVDRVTVKCHNAADGDGDRDGVRQVFIDRLTGGTFHANYLKWNQVTTQNYRVLGATVDDDGVWDGLAPELIVAVRYLRLIVTM